MSTTYINFSAIDFTSVDSLSTYTGEIAPLKFVSELTDDGTYRVLWNFGDNTTSTAFSASKVYDFPGRYNVELVVYGCDNNAMVSTITKTIIVKDFIEMGISVEGLSSLSYPIGQITNPLYVSAFFPKYQSPISIYYTVSGSNSYNYWDIESEKYSHLIPFYTLYRVTPNYSLSSDVFEPISKIDLNLNSVWAKISSNTIVECLSTDSGSVYIGQRGTQTVYYKDDSVSPLIQLDLFLDKTQAILPQYTYSVGYMNNLTFSLSGTVVDNNPTSLSITSCGIDGEGIQLNTFNISPIKYYDVKIPFVIKLKDYEWFSVKNFNVIPLSSIQFSVGGVGNVEMIDEGGELLLDESGNTIYAEGVPYTLSAYTIESLNNTLSSVDVGGVFRGYILFPSLSYVDILQNVFITATATLSSDSLSSYTLSGQSSYFNVYPTGFYDVYKKNENFDACETIKSLRFQETLLDKSRLFDEFIKDSWGDSDSSYDTIGKTLYEKTVNFVDNSENIDTCDIDSIQSHSDFMGLENLNENRYAYPNKIKRWMDLFSIDKNVLFGHTNKFDQNFDIKGRSTKLEYGRNIGDKIDPFTYTVNIDTPLVALEKFSNEYVLLNTYQPLSSVSTDNYKLSTYSSDWGWPLVLPSDFTFSDIEKYYIFFEYVNDLDGTTVGNIIDFNNNQTTVSKDASWNDVNGENGIWNNIILNTLYTSLSVI